MATLLEMADAPGGRLMLLQLAIDSMQEGMAKLGGNRSFILTILNALDDAGSLTDEQLKKRSKAINEKMIRGEPPFDRPFSWVAPEAPDDLAKVWFWPNPAIDRASVDAIREQALKTLGTATIELMQ